MVETVEMYRNYNWWNLMDICDDAVNTGVGEGTLKYNGTFHHVNIIKYLDEERYTVMLDKKVIGISGTLGHMWESLDIAITGKRNGEVKK